MFGLDKPLGLTSLQALEALRAGDPSLRTQRLGHAGRLDPMAEGLLAVLVGEETRAVHALRGMEKTYELEVLFGLATDSFDSLGLLTSVMPGGMVPTEVLQKACHSWQGSVMQRLPPFSQGRVGGRSLLAWGALGVTLQRPAVLRSIASIELFARRSMDTATLVEEALWRLSRVRGAFRQEAIAACWRHHARTYAGAHFSLATFRVVCSAGTYMRALAFDLGEAVGVPALAWRIRRTRVGSLCLDDARCLPSVFA